MVLHYDYALTFGREISGFWSPLQHDWGTLIFLLNRYVMILGYIPLTAGTFLRHPTGNMCHTLQTYHQYLIIIVQFIVGSTVR